MYMSVSQLLGFQLADGYFFLGDRRVIQSPFGGFAVNNHLNRYLTEVNINCRETTHSFRLGLSYTLSMLGCTQDEISHYLGWRSSCMVKHYTRMSNTLSFFLVTGRALSGTELLNETPVSHPSNLQCIV